jgi:1-deoxy-D-xylulose-5-phosphate synthase
MALEKINKVNDIKEISKKEYPVLAEEIRQFLIEKISDTGGHLASNLGVVELTMALHLSFDLPKDKILWDVGHQAYTHKILTGRKDSFDSLRKYGGLSGFPKRKESECDAFDTGHSSTSISAGLGIAAAYELQNRNDYVVSVIGDGAMTGGMAYEALNNASRLKRNYIIVLNDNNMSITENVGGMSYYLGTLRTEEAYHKLKENVEHSLNRVPVFGEILIDKLKRTKSSIKQLLIPGMLFENMGITYLGPVDGHNISQMLRVFRDAKKVKQAVLVHVVTKKGKGYAPAEDFPARFHGVDPFDIKTGLPKVKKEKPTYTDIFSSIMLKLGKTEKNLVAVSAAMPSGTGLMKFKNQYPDRFFDVGIAEEHAVTFAAGMAAAGLRPVVAIYSSFLQRAYDQILHDVCIQNLPVIFAVDRAGLVGSDGETHQGIFDLSYLTNIPNMTVAAPKNKYEMADLFQFALKFGRPIAIRYPKGEAYDGLERMRAPIVYGMSELIRRGKEVALLAAGSMVKVGCQVIKRLDEAGIKATLVNARFIKPIDTVILEALCKEHSLYVTLEENVITGGYGEAVTGYVEENIKGVHVMSIALPDQYVEHGSAEVLKKDLNIDETSITERIMAEYSKLKEVCQNEN